MSVRFWRSAGRFAPSYKALFLCSREICTVPSLYRPSTDGSNIRAGNIYTEEVRHVILLTQRIDSVYNEWRSGKAAFA